MIVRERISFSMLLDEQPKSEVFSITCLKWNDFREGVVLPCKVELIKVPTCGEAGSCCEDWVRQGVSLSTVPGIWWAIKKCQPRLLLVYEMWKFCYTPSNPSLLSTSRSKSYQQSISIQDHSKQTLLWLVLFTDIFLSSKCTFSFPPPQQWHFTWLGHNSFNHSLLSVPFLGNINNAAMNILVQNILCGHMRVWENLCRIRF